MMLDRCWLFFVCANSSNTTYLIDKCGKVKTWPVITNRDSRVISPDGSLLRPGNTNNTIFNAGGKGGVIEK
jgi:hypothetical protein